MKERSTSLDFTKYFMVLKSNMEAFLGFVQYQELLGQVLTWSSLWLQKQKKTSVTDVHHILLTALVADLPGLDLQILLKLCWTLCNDGCGFSTVENQALVCVLQIFC